MANPPQLIRSHIRGMTPYEPILPFEVLAWQLGLPAEDIIKLDANENPYGPLPQVAEALAALPYAHIYPDPESRLLREAIAEHYGIPIQNILAGAGADELIDLVMRLVLDPGDVILNCPPTFGMYAFDAGVNAAQIISVPRKANFDLDLDGIAAAVERYRPKVLFIASPNNPDGSLPSPEVIDRLLGLPVLVVLDEAYVDFAPPGASRIRPLPIPTPLPLSQIGRGEGAGDWGMGMCNNLVVLRTFSKWAGLAGLRVGFGVFPDWIMPHLWKIKQPYNVSVAASTAAIISLQNADRLTANGQRIIAERERLYQALQSIPWLEPYPSQANFILCKVIGRDAAQLKADLAHEGILIRYFNKPSLTDHIRISVGKPEHTDALIYALKAER